VDRIMAGLLRKFLRPGEFYADRAPAVVETLVGSCVAVCLSDFKRGFGVMNHFLMDRPTNPTEVNIGQYGGAAVLKTANVDGHIGSANVEAALEVLRSARIRIAGQEVGGTRGQRIRFNTQTGEIECRSAGDIPGRRAAP
jgi:chemotaxis protein CheD